MLECEKVLSLSDLARALPMVSGKRIHQSTIWRWALKGSRGVKLEALKLGSRYLSSLEAVERYGRAVSEASAVILAERQSLRQQSAKSLADSAKAEAPKPSSALRRRQIERANRELDAAGIR